MKNASRPASHIKYFSILHLPRGTTLALWRALLTGPLFWPVGNRAAVISAGGGS